MTDYHVDRPAGFWIGHPGALLPLPGIKGELSRAAERPVTYKTSAGGNRRAYLSPRRAPLREWQVTIPHLRPDEAATLHELVTSTDPPYLWVDPFSRLTNLLPPSAVTFVGSVPTLVPLGRQPLTGGGWATTAAANLGGGEVNLPPAPVTSGQPVTVSAYLGAPSAGRVTAVFLNSAGAEISGTERVSAPVVGLSTLNRASTTKVVPPGDAAAVSIRITGATVIARPAVTWTADLMPYGAGGGSGLVVLSGLVEAIERAELAANGKILSGISFTVTEVG